MNFLVDFFDRPDADTMDTVYTEQYRPKLRKQPFHGNHRRLPNHLRLSYLNAQALYEVLMGCKHPPGDDLWGLLRGVKDHTIKEAFLILEE